jgi:hypothetical protein
MPSLEHLSLKVFSERGIDQGLSVGRFNVLADMPDQEFADSWAKEIKRFKKRLHEQFAADEVFVSNRMSPDKHFGVEITGPVEICKVFGSILAYITDNVPESSVVIGSVFDSPMPAARLVIWGGGCALDQDALAWFLNRAQRGCGFQICQDFAGRFPASKF